LAISSPAIHDEGETRVAGPFLSVRTGFWICIAIAVAAALRRIFALAHPIVAGPPQLVAMDAVFASHATKTVAHVAPALLFVLLLPFYFSERFRYARWLETSLYLSGALVGITAYVMSAYSIGGWTERSAVLLFNTLYLSALARSAWHRQQGRIDAARTWMTRACGIQLGIATTRPIMGAFFATSPITHLQPSQFFGIAFWIGFSVNTIAVELVLRGTKERKHRMAQG
jgi:hypothetical protein